MFAFSRAIFMFCFLLLLSACLEEEAPSEGAELLFPDLLSEQRLMCERDEGRWAIAPTGGYVCYRNLSDAGKTCQAKGDCEGICLARSRTCAPISPFYGCHEVLSQSGFPQTLCIE